MPNAICFLFYSVFWSLGCVLPCDVWPQATQHPRPAYSPTPPLPTLKSNSGCHRRCVQVCANTTILATKLVALRFHTTIAIYCYYPHHTKHAKNWSSSHSGQLNLAKGRVEGPSVAERRLTAFCGRPATSGSWPSHVSRARARKQGIPRMMCRVYLPRPSKGCEQPHTTYT